MMLTDIAPATAPVPAKTEPTRLDVLRHAREIAIQQGAVKDALRFFETEDGTPIVESPTFATLNLYRHCRVCIAGAAMLAAVRLGYDGGDHDAWYGNDVLPFIKGLPDFKLARIEDNPSEIVRILDLMIAAECQER